MNLKKRKKFLCGCVWRYDEGRNEGLYIAGKKVRGCWSMMEKVIRKEIQLEFLHTSKERETDMKRRQCVYVGMLN